MKVFVAGVSGRMGKEVRTLCTDEILFVGGVSRSAPNSGEKIYPDWITAAEAVNECDMVIDFSLPEAQEDVMNFAKSKKAALVSGVTGLTETHHNSLTKLSKQVPVLWASNMSIGVNLFRSILEKTQWPSHFDVQLSEYHHIHKKDSPSGTAVTLQESLKQQFANAPEPVAVRGGGIYGIHKVDFMSEQEVFSIEHTALNRSVFASGAMTAGRWLVGKKPGMYSMKNVLGI